MSDKPDIDEPGAKATSEADRIDQSCYVFMTDPALGVMRDWWAAEVDRVMVGAGPIDPLRLALLQGDRERRLEIMRRAERHRLRIVGVREKLRGRSR
jgi:hypothetical protein